MDVVQVNALHWPLKQNKSYQLKYSVLDCCEINNLLHLMSVKLNLFNLVNNPLVASSELICSIA